MAELASQGAPEPQQPEPQQPGQPAEQLAETEQPAGDGLDRAGYHFAHQDIYYKDGRICEPPRQIDASEQAAMEADNGTTHSQSRWNTKDYHWEERDLTQFATDRLRELLVRAFTFVVCVPAACQSQEHPLDAWPVLGITGRHGHLEGQEEYCGRPELRRCGAGGLCFLECAQGEDDQRL